MAQLPVLNDATVAAWLLASVGVLCDDTETMGKLTAQAQAVQANPEALCKTVNWGPIGLVITTKMTYML